MDIAENCRYKTGHGLSRAPLKTNVRSILSGKSDACSCTGRTGIKQDVILGHPSQWLRFNCQCIDCRQPHSNQRILNSAAIPERIEVLTAFVTGDWLDLKWSDNHSGRINLQWLADSSIDKYETDSEQVTSVSSKRSELPRFSYKDLTSPDCLTSLYESILKDGFAIVDSLATTPGTVKQFVAEIFKIPVQRTIYGEVFDVMSTDKPINVAYSNAELKPHMDLIYYESPPGLQLLHCLKFDESVEGGESFLIDGFEVAKQMRKTFPVEFEILTNTPATFEKIHYDREWPVHMRYRRPHIVVNDRKQITGFFWAPQFEGPLFTSLSNVDKYYDAYKKLDQLIGSSPARKEFKLKPGEMVIFNNRTMLHGRKAFTVSRGIRHLQGCYVNIDEFQSQAYIALSKKNKNIDLPRVGNQSF